MLKVEVSEDPCMWRGWKRRVCRRNARFLAWREWGRLLGPGRLGVGVLQLGKRRVGDSWRNGGCV